MHHQATPRYNSTCLDVKCLQAADVGVLHNVALLVLLTNSAVLCMPMVYLQLRPVAFSGLELLSHQARHPQGHQAREPSRE